MFANYLKVAFRTLVRQPGYTVINVAGLGLACAVALLFGLLAASLLTYDREYPGADAVYLVHQDIVTAQGERRVDEGWVPLLPALQAEVPQIEAGTRSVTAPHEIRVGESVVQRDVRYVDDEFFDVFPFRFVAGNPAAALADPNGAVVATSAVESLFGRTDPVGQTLVLDGKSEVVVQAVVEVPGNSSVRFDVLIPFAHAEQHLSRVSRRLDDWGASFLYTFIRLHADTDPAAVEAAFGPLLDRHRPDGDARIGLTPAASWRAEQNNFSLYITVFLVVAFGVLAIGAVNFTNLAMAKSFERAREIGVRKTLGAGPGEVATGFLAESGLVALAAVALGAVLTQAVLPGFNDMLEGFLALQLDLGAWTLWAGMTGLVVLVTGMAGLYPALFLARFRPVETLKGRMTARPSSARLRVGLVLFQFTLTVFLLACTLTMHRQVEHVRGLGFDFGSTPVVTAYVSGQGFDEPEAGARAVRALRERLRQAPAVAEASVAGAIPGAYWNTSTVRIGGTDDVVNIRATAVDAHYFDLYGIDIVAGRAFDPDRDGSLEEGLGRVVVNEAFLDTFGWEDIEAKTLHLGEESTWEVVGVVKDFPFAAPLNPTGPVVHVYRPDAGFGWLSVRAATADAGPVLDLLDAEWPAVGSRRSLNTDLAVARYEQQYRANDLLIGLATYAAGLAFVIALVGLIGLAAQTAAQRTKEIGVRKVLGATVGQIVVLLVRGTAGLVVLAAVLAAPLVIVLMNAWLEQYAHRIEVGVGPVALVASTVLVVALLAVSIQAFRAASTDPVRSLRHD